MGFFTVEMVRKGTKPEHKQQSHFFRGDIPVEKRRFVTVDGNEAAANVAHLCNEVMAIYPITPSSGLGELTDAWAAAGRKNIFGTVPDVVEMQSEAGAAGAVHGSLQAGALTTTFTASQGLLLMIPNMFKIAGELTATVFHVTARTVATHALSIFGDHSDVMACRSTGWAMLSAVSVQEAQDMALIAHSATLEARVPFLHFYDGFRISHEVNKIEQITEDDCRAMLDADLIAAHRERALSPERPKLRGTAQNPDVFFQARETCNPYYAKCAGIVQKHMDKFAKLVGRQYHLFDYVGAPDAERRDRRDGLRRRRGRGDGRQDGRRRQEGRHGRSSGSIVPGIRPLWSPHCRRRVKRIAVLDRTKEPGAAGEPLYQDVITALVECWTGATGNAALPKVISGRYGLSSKEFTPAMVAAVYEELTKTQPKRVFVVGIVDDVTKLSLDYDPNYSTEKDDVVRAMFFGLGSDGTVSANRNSVKIVGENTPLHAQGYFVYDSRKAGSVTTSHVRFSPRPIKGSYLVHRANFVACHQTQFLERIDMLSTAVPGATFLLNTPYPADQVWDHLPIEVQKQIIDKKLKFYVIDAYHVARETNMGVRINTIMQTCFFKLANVIPADEAIAQIKDAIKKTYGKKGGEKVIKQNNAAVDAALAALHEVKYPQQATSKVKMLPAVPAHAPAFVKDVLGVMIANRGDDLPVSALPCDGTFPTGTTQYEKRSIAQDIPIWDPSICIQCGLCALGCPHASIRIEGGRSGHVGQRPGRLQDDRLQGQGVSRLEVHRPGRSRKIAPAAACASPLARPRTRRRSSTRPSTWSRCCSTMPPRRPTSSTSSRCPRSIAPTVKADTIKGSQLLQPLFEFSGACAGCGETPYVKLLTQFFGDRMLIGNATGCSSIYGGNLPCTPYSQNQRRPRAVLVQLAVRGLRRVRTRLPPGRRSAVGLRQGIARPAVVAIGRTNWSAPC